MKKSKSIIVLLSVVLLTSFFIGNYALAKNENNPFTELWNALFGVQEAVEELQTQVNELEVASGTTRTVIEGSFNVAANGDVIIEISGRTNHYKRIDIPQLTINDMPMLQAFVKPPSISPTPLLWQQSTAYCAEGYVLLLYKYVTANSTATFMNGEYKIVIVK